MLTGSHKGKKFHSLGQVMRSRSHSQ